MVNLYIFLKKSQFHLQMTTAWFLLGVVGLSKVAMGSNTIGYRDFYIAENSLLLRVSRLLERFFAGRYLSLFSGCHLL